MFGWRKSQRQKRASGKLGKKGGRPVFWAFRGKKAIKN